MTTQIDTIVQSVKLTNTRYFYKPLKKLARYGYHIYDLYKDGEESLYVISDEMLDGTKFIAVEEVTVICDYRKDDKSIFALQIIVDDEEVDLRLLPNLYDMESDEQFQQSLVFEDEQFGFYELLELQEILVKHYFHRSISTSYIKRSM
ncbi:TPA: hypothetical protein ACXNPR_000409 [Enterobacter cancerogenus]